MRNFNKYLPLSILLCGLVIACFYFFWNNSELILPCSLINTHKSWDLLTKKEQDCAEQASLKADREQEEKGSENKLEAAQWPEYKNVSLGIEIQYPENITYSNNAQNNVEFFKVGNTLFVRTASSTLYARKDELSNLSDSEAKLKASEIEKLSDSATDYDNVWEINLFNVKSNTDIQRVIDNWYGADRCVIGDIKQTTYQDTYDVSLNDKYPPKDSEEQGSCWINYVSHIKYSPVYGRLAIWDIGQFASFPYKKCDELTCSADFPMADSFRFIPMQ